MKKRIMAIVLCFVTVLTSVSAGFINFSASSAFPPLAIYYENEKIESINIPQNDKKTVTAISEDARDYEYRWQFLVDVNEDLWVDVYAQNSNELTLSYALLLSAIDNNGSVYLRVAAETDNGTVYSEPVYVTVTPSTEFAPLAEQETQPVRAAKAAPYALAASEEAPLAEDDVRIIINYLDAETGNEMYTSYSVLLKKGEVSTYKQTVLSPTWLGYAPKYYAADPMIGYQDAALATDDASEIIIDIAVNADTLSEIVYNIYYKASEVPYAAKYFYQNLYDDMYSEDATAFSVRRL